MFYEKMIKQLIMLTAFYISYENDVKLSYYGLLIVALKASVNMILTNNVIFQRTIKFNIVMCLNLLYWI